jgi:hypothetical protein
MPYRRFLPLAVFTALLVTAQAGPVKVGDVTIELPAPLGCAELTPAQEPHYGAAQALVPQSNGLLAYYVTKADMERIAQGQAPEFQYTLSAQTPKALEGKFVSPEDFKAMCEGMTSKNAELMAQVEKDAPGLVEKISAELSDKAKSNVDLRFAKMLPMRPHAQTENSLAFTNLITLEVPGEGGAEPRNVTRAVDTSVLLLGGKVIYLYFNSPTAKLETVQLTGKEWREAVLAANPAAIAANTAPAVTGSGRGGNFWLRVAVWAVIGAVIGGAYSAWKNKRNQGYRK